MSIDVALALSGVAVLLAVIEAVAAIYFVDRFVSDAKEQVKGAFDMVARVTAALTISRTGLNPHVVDPDRFGTTGMSRGDEVRLPEQEPPARQVPPESEHLEETERLLREAEAEFFLAQRQYAERFEGPPRASHQ